MFIWRSNRYSYYRSKQINMYYFKTVEVVHIFPTTNTFSQPQIHCTSPWIIENYWFCISSFLPLMITFTVKLQLIASHCCILIFYTMITTYYFVNNWKCQESVFLNIAEISFLLKIFFHLSITAYYFTFSHLAGGSGRLALQRFDETWKLMDHGWIS